MVGAAGAREPELPRRHLLVAASTAAAALLAGCSRHSSRPKVHKIPSPSRDPDVALLNHALDLEHAAIAAYTAGIPLLTGAAHAAAKHFLDQELDHAGEIAGLIKQAGGKGNKPQLSYDFGHPRTAADVLALLHRVEHVQLAAYLEMIPRLSPGSVRAAVSTVLANDAQHVAGIRATLGLAATSSLVTGAE